MFSIKKFLTSTSLLATVCLVMSCSGTSKSIVVPPSTTPLPPVTNTVQLITGIVTGLVLDVDTGGGLAGVKVEIKGLRPAVSTITDATGKFSLPRVPVGKQVISVSKKDYVMLNGNSNIVVDVQQNKTSTAPSINMYSQFNSNSNAFIKVFEGFKHPKGLAVDRNNSELYVVDVIGVGGIFSFDRAEIKKITSDGGQIDSFGSRWIDERTTDLFRLLRKSTGIGVDAGGNVYVADTGSNTVKKYGVSGRYINKIDKSFKNLTDVAITTQGDIVISDPGSSKVSLYDSSLTVRVENLLGPIPSDGVRGITTDNADNIYIIDATGKPNEVIKKYDRFGNPLPLKFGSLGGLDAGRFNNPTDIAIDNRNGDIYIVDSGNNRVQRFNSNGNFLSEFGQFGSDNGFFNTPWGIAVDKDGFVYIADTMNARVQKFTPGRKAGT
jgi:sugar lactone lactonase YvrE